MKKLLILLVVSAVSFIHSKVFSQPGSLDPSFSNDGRATTGFNIPQSADGNSVALQQNGKMVVGGGFFNGSNIDFALLRYNINGSVDLAFSSDGKVTMDIGGANQSINALAIQGNGKIIGAGYSFDGSKDKFAVLRFNTDGSPDETFGTGGIVTTSIGTGDSRANAVAIQADGKIVVGGFSINGGPSSNITLVRYNPDGTRDGSFNFMIGGSGVVTTVLEGSSRVLSIVLEGNKILAGGSYDLFGSHLVILRYNADGSLDKTFNSTGIVTDGGILASSIAVQNGKIVAAGQTVFDEVQKIIILRYNNDGSRDKTFNSTGWVKTTIGSNQSKASSVAIQGDGKILAGGFSRPGSKDAFTVVRYNVTGSLDKSFSSDGIADRAIGRGNSQVNCLKLRPDGKIVVAGYSELKTDLHMVAMARFSAGGILDNTFGTDGIVISELRGSKPAVDIGQALAIQPDGKIVVAGISNNSVHNDLAIVRFKTSGSVDAVGAMGSGFNGNGKVVRVFSRDFSASAVAIQSDGKILVAGSLDNGSNLDIALLRYNSNGTYDNNFSVDGMVTTPIGNSHDVAYSLAVQQDGKILVAGYSNNGGNVDFALVRYNLDGSLDNFFNYDGRATTDFGNRDNYGTSMAIQQDGKIVVAGYSYNGSNYDFAVVRYKSNGDPDPTFNNLTGKATTDISGNDYGHSVAIQPDGKIVVAGNSYNGTDWDFSVVRYNSNGTRDNNFSGDGKQLTTIDGSSNDYAKAVTIQQDGKIIVAGYSEKSSVNKHDFAIVRYSSTGTADGTFGTNGKVLTDFNATNDYGNAMALQQDGKLVVAGRSNNDFAVARYNMGGAVGGQSGILEAEQAVLSGAVVSSSQPGYTGSGFADYVNASNDYIEWTLNASAAGSFSLKFRYSNGAGSNRPLKLQVNGVQIAASLAFAPTGGWATWALSSSNANLVAGNNKIKLSTTGSNGPNVDHLAFSSGAAAQAAERTVVAKELVSSSPDFLKASLMENPVIVNAKIIVSCSSEHPIDLQIIDMSGRTYKKLKVFGKGSGTYNLPVSGMPAGFYTIILKQGKITANAKLVVAR